MNIKKNNFKTNSTLEIKKNNEKLDFYKIPFYKKYLVPVPNIILRSSLFGITEKGKRKYETNNIKSSYLNYKIIFTGETFDQSDLDVFLGLIYFSQTSNFCKFSNFNFLKFLGRSTGNNDFNWLNKSLFRIHNSIIKLFFYNKNGNFSYSGNFITDWYKHENSNTNFIKLNKKIIYFFFNTGWKYIKFSDRLKLKGKPLAQWIFNFYCSHKKPFPIKIEKIHLLSGSKNKIIKKFKQILKRSLIEVTYVTNWYFKIDINNIIYIVKKTV